MEKMGRKAYYVPMIHVKEEMGTLEKPLIEMHSQTMGSQQLREFFQEIDNFWKMAEGVVEQAGLYQPAIASQLHLFVDSLPNSREDLVQKRVQYLITQGIPAYQIVKKLLEAGAVIHGTEDATWLLEEAQYWKNVVLNGQKRDPEWEKQSLEKRDQAIISRVNEIVPDGETAIIFIGRKHNVVERLADDFEVINL